MLNIDAIFAEPSETVLRPVAKPNSPQVMRSEAVQAAEPKPCIDCGSAIFWRTQAGTAGCAGCSPRLMDARKGLIVTIDGRNEWADYATEAEIVRRRRDTIC